MARIPAHHYDTIGPSFQLTFQGHPVLLPLAAAGHELQLAVFVQRDERFEGEPAGPPHHTLLLLEQHVQLLHGALGRLAAAVALLGAGGRLPPLAAAATAPRRRASFQLPHEVLVDVLADGVAGRLVDGAR